ncbi:MAG TPA: sigma-70 family RNA polymerase sigma factor, partial [Planctomycetota bacterium]|nr:sigma-70 family RNA polymerase sigma factor [Planctomycetota bacterium]
GRVRRRGHSVTDSGVMGPAGEREPEARNRGLEEHLTRSISFLRECLAKSRKRLDIARVDIDDAFQDVFVKAWQALPSFHPKSEDAILRWLQRIVKNHVIDLLRTAARAARRARAVHRAALRASADRPGAARPLDGALATTTTPFDLLMRQEDEAAFAAGLTLLPVPQQVVLLVYIEHKSVAEVAGELGIRPDAVRMRLRRASYALLERRRREERRHDPADGSE